MRSHPPIAAEKDHRVVKFRPRASEALRHDDAAASASAGDEPDDFKHRMWANAAAFAFTVALTGFGIWLAVKMSDVRIAQDCVLMGRRDCARLTISPAAAVPLEQDIRRH